MIPRLSSLRLRLLLFALLVVTPAFGLTLHTALEERQKHLAEVQEEALRLARLAASSQGRLVEGAREVLATLARLPAVRGLDPRQCSPLLAELLPEYPHYVSLLAARADGEVVCSAMPLPEPLNVARRAYFQRAVQTRTLAVGDYPIGPLGGRPVLELGQPLLSPAGRVVGVILAGLDPAWLVGSTMDVPLPPGTALLTFDRNGTILARAPDLSRWVGKPVGDTPLSRMLQAGGGRAGEGPGVDGVARIWGVTRLGGIPAPAAAYTAVGLATEPALARVNRALARNLAVLGLVAATAFALAWVGADFLLLRRTRALLAATWRLAAGDLDARTGLGLGRDEVGELGRALDEMAASLQARQAEIERAGAALRDSEASFRLLFADNPLPMWVFDARTLAFLEVNAAAVAHYGYSRDEFLRMQLPDLWPPEELPRLLDTQGPLRQAPAAWLRPANAGEWRHRLKDGRVIDVAIVGHPLRFGGRQAWLVVARDITERKRAQEAARAAQARLEHLVTAGPAMIFSFPPVTNAAATFVSENIAAQLGYGVREFLDTPGFWAERVHPEDAPRVFGSLPRLVERGRLSQEYRFRHKDGSYRWMHEQLRLVRDAGGAPLEVVGSWLDITDRKRAEAESERRRRETEALTEVGGTLTESLDLGSVGQRIVDSVAQLFGSASTALRLLRPDGSLEAIAFGGRARERLERGHVMPPGVGLLGRAVAEGRPAWSRDLLDDPGVILPEPLRRRFADSGERALLVVPLVVKAAVIGTLAVAENRPRDFSASEVALLQAFADQAAVAVENARLYWEAERRRWEAEVVAELARTINAPTDVAAILERVAWAARDLCASDVARIALRVPGSEAMSFRYWIGSRAEGGERVRIERGRGLGGLALATGRPVRTDNYAEDPRISADAPELAREEGTVAALVVPIRMEARVEGLLFVANRSPRPFTDRDETLLVRLADHAAIALRKAQLLAEEHAARAEAEATAERIRAIEGVTEIALAHADLDDLLGALLGRIREALGAATATILLLAENGRELVARASSGLEEEAAARVRVPLGAGIAGRIAARGEPVVVEDLSSAVAVSPFLSARMRSLAGVPLVVGGRPIGVVQVATTVPRHFTEADVRLLQLLADRVASSIDRARLFEDVSAAGERLQRLSQRLLEVQEAERRHIARELHDQVGQALTAVKINLQALRRLPAGAALAARLEENTEIIDRVLEGVRTLSLDLRPSLLDDLGLVAALRWYVHRQAERAGLAADFTADLPERTLSAPLGTACFRVTQEAVTNVVRHAGARRVAVVLASSDGELELRICDDGAGFDVTAARERAARGGSLGLLGMEERAHLLGGRLHVVSAPGRGTEVRASFPLDAPAAGAAPRGGEAP